MKKQVGKYVLVQKIYIIQFIRLLVLKIMTKCTQNHRYDITTAKIHVILYVNINIVTTIANYC